MYNTKKIFLLVPLIICGCGMHKAPEAKLNFYLNADKDLSTIGRVTLIELGNSNVAFPQISSDATEALSLAFQKKQLFGLTVIRQNDPIWQSLQLDVDDNYTLEQISAIRKSLKSDAVIIGKVMSFSPYPHMAIGLRLKLIDLNSGQMVWAIEQIWDTTDKTVEDRIKGYYDDKNLFTQSTLQEKIGTISSLKFIKFVADETAETLQKKK